MVTLKSLNPVFVSLGFLFVPFNVFVVCREITHKLSPLLTYSTDNDILCSIISIWLFPKNRRVELWSLVI